MVFLEVKCIKIKKLGFSPLFQSTKNVKIDQLTMRFDDNRRFGENFFINRPNWEWHLL
tara:strand:- start:807 stop:980 length:174 start_codon:yes stop_codon:yes gene_type:complete